MKRVFLFLGIVLFAAIPIFVAPRLIVIKNIVCQSQFGECSEYIRSSLSDLRGKTLSEAKNLAEQTLMDQVNVKEYSTNLKLPNTLDLELVERKAIVAVIKSGENLRIFVDNEGIIVGDGQENLPELNLGEEYRVTNIDPGSSLPEKLYFASLLVSELDKNFDYRGGQVGGGSLQVNIGDKLVIFPLEGDRKLLLGSLQLILVKGKNQEKPFSQIDLRFKDPILR